MRMCKPLSLDAHRAALDDQGLGHKAEEFAAKGVDTFSALAALTGATPSAQCRTCSAACETTS